jgi:hypothetical protein
MKIPNFIDSKIVETHGGLTDTWKQIFIQLLQNMQNTLSDEGFALPQETTTNITKLETTQSVGRIIYDKTTNQFKACVLDGTTPKWKVITLV